jgi:microcystin degradation protein MlrC
MKKYRIALGSLMTECNHLGGQPTDLRRFEIYELRRGAEVLEASGATGGMAQVLRENDAEIAPLVVATACPGGPLTSECYRVLKSEMQERLRASLPVDGVLLALHGSATVEDVPDLEGDLLKSTRELAGASTPIVATLDPHGHVTQTMIENADALLAFETYPHVDTHQTGARAARLLYKILREKLRPTMAMVKAPVLVSGVNGTTEGAGPFADVMRLAKSFEGTDGVLSTSAFLVHPYLDLPEMGGGGLVVTDGDLAQAERLSRAVTELYWQKRFALEPETFSPPEAIQKGLEIAGGPVLLVETADCCGGGAAGDSVATLRALLEAGLSETSLAPVVDPPAAALCHAAGAGAEIEIEIGHKLDPKWGEPLRVQARVLRLGAGRFTYAGGNWDGVEADMGRSAVVQIGRVQVLITTHATYDWADEQFCALGMNTRDAKFIVVKNPMNYRIGYAGIARAAYILDTPGPTPATLRGVEYARLARPYFPADPDIPDLQFQILRGKC